jgi:glycoside hydrolase-like protein
MIEISGGTAVAQGIDYAWSRPEPSVIAAAGYEFVCRYVSHDTTGKNLTLAEAVRLSNAGLSLVIVFESTASRMLVGTSAGIADAQFAVAEAAKLGMPPTRPIYFACDFDATPGQQTVINAYLDGVATVIPRERIGMYGGYGPIKRAFDTGKITFGWQTYAWSGGAWDKRAQIQQYSNDQSLGGVKGVDLNRSTTEDYGQWKIGTNMTISSADADKIAKAVLNLDGVIPSLDPADPNKYRALRTHIFELGMNLAEVRKIVSDGSDADAIIAGVLAGFDELADRIVEGVVAGILSSPQPVPVVDTDLIASKVVDQLVRRARGVIG